MKIYIELIKQILKEGGQITDCENFTSKFIMNLKASFEDLLECDLYFEGKLPDDYKYFLNFFDGGDLFNYNDIGGFAFFSSKRIIHENKFQRENHKENDLEEYWDNNVILFATFICGDAEYLGFRIKENKEYDILDLTLYEPPSEWRIIDNSFDNFVEKLIKEKGKPYWFYSPYSS